MSNIIINNKKSPWFYVAIIAIAVLIVALVVVLVVDSKPEKKDEFYPSEGIDKNGFWKNIDALDYVDLFDYKTLSIPSEAYQVSDSDVQAAIDDLLVKYAKDQTIQVKDRAVVDGDNVNISYVGSVDGVPFDGGSTGDGGTNVTAGSADYIDDFLTQIIGHMPGETFNVEVTFPEVYSQNPDLQNKDAVFVTTINYIEERELPELTDEFVATVLFADYEWKTVAELKAGLKENLKNDLIRDYVWDYLYNEVTVSSVPSQLIAYYEKSMVAYYQSYAKQSGIEFDEFITTYLGASSLEDLLTSSKEENKKFAAYTLVCQAIAEDAKLSVKEDDLVKYLGKDYSTDYYGLPYLKQYALSMKVVDYVIEHVVIE